VLEQALVNRDSRPSESHQFVEQALLHHRRGLAALVEAEVAAGGVARADVAVDRVADARHVRALGKVVAAAARPDEHVVGQVAGDGVGLRTGSDRFDIYNYMYTHIYGLGLTLARSSPPPPAQTST